MGYSPNNQVTQEGEQKVRVRLPRDKEVVGFIDQRVGGSRMLIRCSDGKVRNCKVPGRLRRQLWLRERDYVIVQPWEFDDGKGDIIFKFTPAAIEILKTKGYLKGLQEEF